MPNDRLAALRRQRTLVAQHLAWLDAEISTATAATAPDPAPADAFPPPPLAASSPPPATTLPPAPETEEEKLAIANARANAILEEYAVTDRFNPQATRRGCLLFAIAVFLFGVAGLLALYFFRYR